jgi:hypothetical protein
VRSGIVVGGTVVVGVVGGATVVSGGAVDVEDSGGFGIVPESSPLQAVTAAAIRRTMARRSVVCTSPCYERPGSMWRDGPERSDGSTLAR